MRTMNNLPMHHYAPSWKQMVSSCWAKCLWAVWTTAGRSRTVTVEEGYSVASSRANAPEQPAKHLKITWLANLLLLAYLIKQLILQLRAFYFLAKTVVINKERVKTTSILTSQIYDGLESRKIECCHYVMTINDPCRVHQTHELQHLLFWPETKHCQQMDLSWNGVWSLLIHLMHLCWINVFISLQ